MPISNERVPNRPLSGLELAKIIQKDVQDILSRDGMFTNNIAFARVSYEVRVSLHLDNPVYPEHISTTLSRPASKQQVEAQPELAAIETSPLKDPLSVEELIASEERHREIQSPNMARVEHEMPLTVEKRNIETGAIEQKEVKYTGDTPDPATVGNKSSDKNTSSDQRDRWGRPRRGGK